MASFKIGDRSVGVGHVPIVFAEIGINHEGDVDVALEMARAAIDAGAEVVKLQTHVPEDEMSREAGERVPGNADVSILEIMKRCALSAAEEKRIFDYVNERGSMCISTPFSRAAVDRLAELNVPAVKIGSGECSNYPLVEYIAQLGVPVIMSTGMHTVDQIRPSVEILRRQGVPFALLHTTNLYPTPNRLVRLGALNQLAESFPDAVIGLSDHTVTNYSCLGAVALGASILERHFTDRMDRPGPDIVNSMDPSALADLLEGSRLIHESLGGEKGPAPEESVTMDFALGSVVATRNIGIGEELTKDNIFVMRPAGGDFGPADYEALLGRTCLREVAGGTQLPRNAVH